MHTVLLLYTEVHVYSGKALSRLFELLFMEQPFYLKKCLTAKPSFQIKFLADIFIKMKKVSLLLSGKQLSVFVANDEIWHN